MTTLRQIMHRLSAATPLLAALLFAANPAAAQAGAGAGQTLGRIAGERVIYLGHREAARPFSYVIPAAEVNGRDSFAGYS